MKKESDCSVLDNSLTNIQWLGKMETHPVSAEPEKKSLKESSKENLDPSVQLQEV